jgi:hypothetical protein
MQMKWFGWYGVKACATESFQWTQRVQKEPFLGPKWGPIKWGHFTPFSGGVQKRPNFRLLMVLESIDIRLGQRFSWFGVKACATNCFSGLKESKKSPFWGPNGDP